MKRRDLLKTGVTALAASLAAKTSLGEAILNTGALTQIPKRRYAEGIDLSIIGFGGIVVVGMEQAEANRIVSHAVDAGVNYFDVAPTYADGEAEEKLGIALKPFRKDVFLACKTTERRAEGSLRELEISLKRTGVDHFDLYQFHAISKLEEVEQILGPAGAAETFLKAQKEGKIRFIGFSAHSEEAALALLDRFVIDSVLFPINFVCYAQGNFGPRVVQKAKEKGAARLALKALAYTPRQDEGKNKYPKCWYEPVSEEDLAEKALRFTLSQDITAAIPPGDEDLFGMALKIARKFTAMDKKEQEELLLSTEGLKSLFPLG
jgi:aryl-alcohol dehydrogenase-like predicted oxidoreductase